MTKLDMYVIVDGKKMRCGYTSGSCAAAASKAAVLMLESGKRVDYIEIDTPADVVLKLKVQDQIIEKDRASCSIKKDAGDDPDSTDKIHIFAEVKRRKDRAIIIEGGLGIGRIKSKGFLGEVGEAAINPVPRSMIKKEIRGISEKGYDVLIYAPEGVEIGKKTFNKNIGIEGGISIIGTKGIVYPMSEDAFIKTIYLEIDMVEKENGNKGIVFVPGNYGEKLADSLDIGLARVKVSNFIGKSLLYAQNKAFKEIILIGHIGKFSKLALGIFQTHSKTADTRMESFIYYLALMGAPKELLHKIKDTLTAEEALEICIENGYGDIIRHMEKGAEERIKKYLKDENFNIRVIIYSMNRGVYKC